MASVAAAGIVASGVVVTTQDAAASVSVAVAVVVVASAAGAVGVDASAAAGAVGIFLGPSLLEANSARRHSKE